jgi:CheY-like chemotaxis protein
MRVLIADFDRARGGNLAEAAGARGHTVDRVNHGAAALEKALERVPDVVICPIDLPVIDGVRLSEILRGNPRLRHASFVYLVKDELDAPIAMDPRDAIVVSPWAADGVLEQLQAILQRNARFGEARPESEIEGKLSQISACDLLQMFQMNQQTGTLRIYLVGTQLMGTIWLHEGQITDARVPLPDGGAVVGEKALYRLLTWRNGRFQFLPEDVPSEGRIETQTRTLLLEGARQLDEWNELRRDAPADDMRLRFPEPPVAVSDDPEVALVAETAKSFQRVSEIIDHCPLVDCTVLKVLRDLVASGALVSATTAEALSEAAPPEEFFSESQRRRLRDWAAGLRPRQGPVIKLLVVAAEPAHVRALYDQLSACADFAPDPRCENEAERVGRIGTLGHFEIGEDLTVRIICLRADSRYEPLWDLAAHGMLGAIVLQADGAEATERAHLHLQRAGAVVALSTPAAAGASLESLRKALGRLIA